MDHTDALCEAFTAEYGIECEGRGINAGQIVGTLTAEREAGEAPTDVVFMSMTQMGQYVDKGFAAELDWEALGVEPRRSWEALEGIEGNAAGVGNDQYTNFYRTDEFSEADLPKTIADWLDPKYKGLVCAPSFLFRAGNGFIAFYYDKDEMVDIHKRMIEENDLLVTDDCNDFILSGERPLMYLGYGNPPVLLDSGVIGQFWNPGFGVNMFNVAVARQRSEPQRRPPIRSLAHQPRRLKNNVGSGRQRMGRIRSRRRRSNLGQFQRYRLGVRKCACLQTARRQRQVLRRQGLRNAVELPKRVKRTRSRARPRRSLRFSESSRHQDGCVHLT